MSNQFVEGHPQAATEQVKRTAEVAGAGATAEAIGAAAAIVLAIVGLAGTLTAAMMAIATIIVGIAIVLDAGTLTARYHRLVQEVWAKDEHFVRAEFGTGISAGALSGIAGIVLGILSLLGMAPTTLCAAALIAFGAALLFGSAAKGRLASLSTARFGMADAPARVIDEAMGLSAGGEVFVGIGGVVLGILSLLAIQPDTLVLVGLLGVSATVLMGGSAFGARMFAILRHTR